MNWEVGIAHEAVSRETAEDVLAFLQALPESAWGPVNERSKGYTRLRYGENLYGNSPRGYSPHLPALLRQLGREAAEAVRAAVPDATDWETLDFDTLVVNRYNSEKGVAPHKDPPRWRPIVVGVTLRTDAFGVRSRMRFHADTGEKCEIVTPHRSVYYFYKSGYTDAKHERRPSPKAQKDTIYSLTFRMSV